ncbi:MAG: hypothetical protein IVW57_00155 [Ktedonobacterales bacterium]|nr:hypothetical protein [Ktedonobacterales bacterium]
MGMGAVIITFSPSTQIRSADVNSNLAALNNAANPAFTTVAVSTSFSAGGRVGSALSWVDSNGYFASSTGVGGLVLDGTPLNGDAGFGVFIKAGNPGSNNGTIDMQLQNTTGGWIYFYTKNAAAHIDQNGHFFDAGGEVAVTGSHSAGQTIISYGTGTPSALAANEIFVQLS